MDYTVEEEDALCVLNWNIFFDKTPPANKSDPVYKKWSNRAGEVGLADSLVTLLVLILNHVSRFLCYFLEAINVHYPNSFQCLQITREWPHNHSLYCACLLFQTPILHFQFFKWLSTLGDRLYIPTLSRCRRSTGVPSTVGAWGVWLCWIEFVYVLLVLHN